MFERFTERARQVVVLAQDESRAFKHDYIGTEHILLGLLREEEGLAARVLESLGVTVEYVRAQVARIVGPGEKATAGQIPFTPRTKKVLELSLREAISLGQNYIGTEHILLGVLKEGEGVAAHILLDRGVDVEKIRNEIVRRYKGAPGPPFAFAGPQPPEPRWKYQLVPAESELLEERLNELGAEGWELTAVFGDQLVFKRVY
jgi:ATP-dependent Clp protease ATP-binding subunit ClpC